jgi:pyruvate,orthophosphate dikinase
MTKWVYSFGNGSAEGNAAMAASLGAKGAGLAEMCRLGLPVPPGFTITAEACAHYQAHIKAFPPGLRDQVDTALARLGCFGDAENPLLVSVRPDAVMPRGMETLLNLGLNAAGVDALAKRSGDARFAWDTYCRFIQNYAASVLGLEPSPFEQILDARREDKGVDLDAELEAADLRAVAEKCKAHIRQETGADIPEDGNTQLWSAIIAALESWRSPPAIAHRRLHGIADSGQAITIQVMVFGNRGTSSAAGITATRDPATGEKILRGEFLPAAQGDELAAAMRTPRPLTRKAREEQGCRKPAMEEAMPAAFAELTAAAAKLECHFRDMQDIEFTIEQGRLFLLQTGPAKRDAGAALRIAVEMVSEGLIDEATALRRVDAGALDSLLHPMLDPDAPRQQIAAGLGASPGAVTGEIAFTAEEAERSAVERRSIILVRGEITADDIRGVQAARGVLTARGGLTSHAAVVARGMGRPCVCGAGMVRIDAARGVMQAGGVTLERGDLITIDGASGQVFKGRVAVRQPELTGDFAVLMDWADRLRRLKVRANADTTQEAAIARKFGAEGIGLCRTEHMFFEPGRIVPMRRMILADSVETRAAALAELLPLQRGDFEAIFKVMAGLPVTIRLLDPPLHEFLPQKKEDIAELARAMGGDAAKLRLRLADLRESNPMLGHRGCRLGITSPDIYAMQVRAILEAAANVQAQGGAPVQLEIMVPLVGFRAELELVAENIAAVAATILRERGTVPAYHIGAMIELPRAAICADEIAQIAEFFSFGTNDLTQTTLGISRDDAEIFITEYLKNGIMVRDPFVSIDRGGVGALITIAAGKGRRTRVNLKLGLCGEHGGDADSIRFCHDSELDYVSCSPFRVPIARLAAAQATLKAV